MQCMVFTNEADALTAKKQIWKNYLISYVTLHPDLCANSVAEINSMTNEEASNVVLYGYKHGVINTEEGFTTTFVDYTKKYLTDEWFLPYYVEYSTGVVGYNIEESQVNWFEPVE